MYLQTGEIPYFSFIKKNVKRYFLCAEVKQYIPGKALEHYMDSSLQPSESQVVWRK